MTLVPSDLGADQVTGVGYSGAGEVFLDGEVIHGFSCPSITKIVEVRPSCLLLCGLHRHCLGWLCV